MLLDPRKLLAEPGFPRETVLPLVVAYIFETRRIARQEFVAKRQPEEARNILADALAAAGYSDKGRKLARYTGDSEYSIGATLNSNPDKELRALESRLFAVPPTFDGWDQFRSDGKRRFQRRMRFNLLYTRAEQQRLLEQSDGLDEALARDEQEHPLGAGPMILPDSVRRFCEANVSPDIQYTVLVDSDNYGIHYEIDKLLAGQDAIAKNKKKRVWRQAMDRIMSKFAGDVGNHQPAGDSEEQLRIALAYNQECQAEVKGFKAVADQLREERDALEQQLALADARILDSQKEHEARTRAIDALEQEKKQLQDALKAERSEKETLKKRLTEERVDHGTDKRQAVEDERLRLDKELTSLRLELLDIKKKLGICMVDATLRDNVDREFKALQLEHAALRTKYDDAVARLAIPKPERANEEEHLATIADLTRQLNACRDSGAQQTATLNDEISEQFVAQIAELEEAQEKARDLHAKLQAELDDVSKRYAACAESSDEAASLRDQKARLEEELRTHASDCRMTIEKCRAGADASKDVVERLTQENALLQGQIDALRASAMPLPEPQEGESDEFAEAKAGLGVEMEKLQAAMEGLINEKNEIANREKELREELATARKAFGDVDRLKADLDTVQAEKRELENREAAATAKIEQLTTATTDAVAATTNALALQAKLDELQRTKTELEARLAEAKTGDLQELRDEVSKQYALIRSQRKKIAVLNKRRVNKDCTPLAGYDVLEKVVAEILSNLEKFEYILGSAERDEVPAKLKGLADSLERSMKKLKNIFGDESGHQAHVKELQAEVDAKNRRIAELEDEVALTRITVAGLKTDLATAEATCGARVDELKQKLRAAEENATLCDARVESVRLERANRIAELERRLAMAPAPPAPSVVNRDQIGNRFAQLSGQLREDAVALRMLSLRLA